MVEVELLRSKCAGTAAMDGAEGGGGGGQVAARLEEEVRVAKCRVKEMEEEGEMVEQDGGRRWRRGHGGAWCKGEVVLLLLKLNPRALFWCYYYLN